MILPRDRLMITLAVAISLLAPHAVAASDAPGLHGAQPVHQALSDRHVVDSPESNAHERLATIRQHFDYDALDQLRNATGFYSTDTGRLLVGTHGPGGVFLPETRHSYTNSFTYDEIGRMLTNNLADSVEHGISIRPSTTTRNQSYTYTGTSLHAPSQINDPTNPSISRSFHWDADGNQIDYSGSSDSDAFTSRTTVWDNENRVVSITNNAGEPGSTHLSFLYDPDGNRTHKIASDGTTTLYPGPWASIRSASTGGRFGLHLDTETNHVYAGEVRVASDVGGGGFGATRQAYWYHGDHLSSTNYVTDEAGVVTEHVEYLPYGEPWIDEQGRAERPQPNEEFLFTSKELDPETGLYYFGARYYDPAVAMWVSPDPALPSFLRGGGTGGVWNPANLELYTYGWNSPVRLLDTDGRDIVLGAGVDRAAFAQALQYLTRDRVAIVNNRVVLTHIGGHALDRGTTLVRRLADDRRHTATVVGGAEFRASATGGGNSTIEVNYASNWGVPLVQPNGRTTVTNGPQPTSETAIATGSELSHADREARGVALPHGESGTAAACQARGCGMPTGSVDYVDALGTRRTDVEYREELDTHFDTRRGTPGRDPATITEAALRREHHLPARGAYSTSGSSGAVLRERPPAVPPTER